VIDRRFDFDSEPVGTPLTPPRPCPSCGHEHPVGTTCWQCDDCVADEIDERRGNSA
jgi:hypothetical protein